MNTNDFTSPISTTQCRKYQSKLKFTIGLILSSTEHKQSEAIAVATVFIYSIRMSTV